MLYTNITPKSNGAPKINVFRKKKKFEAPAGASHSHINSLPYKLKNKEQSSLRFKFLGRPGIVADRAENWHVYSRGIEQEPCKSWAQSVPISPSYDFHDFLLISLRKTTEKIAIFEKFFLGCIIEFSISFFTDSENTTYSCSFRWKNQKIRRKIVFKIWPNITIFKKKS